MEQARLIKSPDEILCMRRAIVACEAAMGEMQAALRPGISENELWAELHRGNIARGGEWIETRLLSSGPRTNPWFQECSSRMHRGRRPCRLRHRPDRPLRLLRRPVAHLALRRRRRRRTSSASCSPSPPTRSRATPS